MWPKISVVTPSFRCAHLIESTIRSVLSQGYPNLEYIVIDGGGDDTAEILKRYSAELAYWCSERDNGQYDAINKGFRRATGDVLMWLNADDLLLPNSLFVIGELFRDFPEVEWISTLQQGFWDAQGYLSGIHGIPGLSKQAFLDGICHLGVQPRGFCIQQESTCFRRSLWDKAGGAIPSGYDLAGDFALWCAFYRHAELVGVSYPIAGFRFRAGQRSEAAEAYWQEALVALELLRKECGWKSSLASVVRSARFRGVTRLARRMSKQLDYVGQRIDRIDVKMPDAKWRLRTHHFGASRSR